MVAVNQIPIVAIMSRRKFKKVNKSSRLILSFQRITL
jgi:hypothetical protein